MTANNPTPSSLRFRGERAAALSAANLTILTSRVDLPEGLRLDNGCPCMSTVLRR
jgi:hypothetical protein